MKCLCFDLKNGYLAYVVLNLAGRVMLLSYFRIFSDWNIANIGRSLELATVEIVIGWLVTAIFFCSLAIVGIYKDNRMLIYPYIVILITEMVYYTLACVIFAIIISPIFIAVLFIVGIYSYDPICLISLYKSLKKVQANEYSYTYEVPTTTDVQLR